MMSETMSTSNPEKVSSALSTILFAGLLAGFLAGAAASIKYYIDTGNNPTRAFQYIASAVFGKKAYSGDLAMAAWGLGFHFLIALGFSGVFFLVYPVLFKFLKNKFVLGIVYGLVVWVIMNMVVVPLTRAAQFPFNIKGALIGMVILIFMVGIPVAMIIHRYYVARKAIILTHNVVRL